MAFRATRANLITTALVISALIVAGLAVHRWVSLSAEGLEVRRVSNAPALAKKGIQVGPRISPVVITVFTDYQCPYCREFDETLRQLRNRYPERVAVSYRHYPLNTHNRAEQAAIASVCASEQGQFEAYHRLLFEHAQSLSSSTLDSLAQEVEIPDLSEFKDCRSSSEARRSVQMDRLDAQATGVDAVPTFLVGDRLVSGSLSFDALDRLVQHSLNS